MKKHMKINTQSLENNLNQKKFNTKIMKIDRKSMTTIGKFMKIIKTWKNP